MIYDDLTVYVRDGWSKVVRMPERGIVGAVRRDNGWDAVWSDHPDPSEEGWSPVLKGVRSRTEGWAYAAIHHGALPADYDNRLKARPMAEALPFFRAVSLPEMADILRTGAVSGGGNSFHDFDDRPFVFFADTITPKVIWQGEEIERSLGQSIRLQAEELEAAYEGYMEELEYEARKALGKAFRDVAAFNQKREELGPMAASHVPQSVRDGEQLLKMLSRLEHPLDWNEFRNPRSRSFRDAKWLHIVPGLEADRMLREFQDARHALTEEFKANYRQMHEERLREREAMSFTSAVIETRPIDVGFHFSKRFGGSGMGEEDEYGLFRNQVRAEDIVSVRWVKDGKVLEMGTIEDAPHQMQLLEQERSRALMEASSMAP